jgi:hypothetical protein
MAIIAFETGETFSPSIVNPLTGGVGLLQIFPPAANTLGTTTSQLAQMDAVSQLEYVAKYLQPFRGRISSLDDLTAALEWPAAVGKPSDYVIARSGSAAYERLRSLDANHDGMVTKEELSSRALWLPGMQPERDGYAAAERRGAAHVDSDVHADSDHAGRAVGRSHQRRRRQSDDARNRFRRASEHAS